MEYNFVDACTNRRDMFIWKKACKVRWKLVVKLKLKEEEADISYKKQISITIRFYNLFKRSMEKYLGTNFFDEI
jgi:hypothetical protein